MLRPVLAMKSTFTFYPTLAFF